MKVWPGVTIIIIGHNEEKNLEKSLKASKNIDYPKDKIEVIFVNSKSTDNSLNIAKKYADVVLSTKNFWSTAGEAFNLGIKRSTHDYVHISAGDIILDKDYLKKAILKITSSPNIDCVTGYFTEKKMSKWNRLISYRREENSHKKPGYVLTPNGGTFRKKVLFELDGYDERIKKGQESELGMRMQEEGYRIWHLQIPQGVHDFDLRKFSDLLKRYYMYGFSSALIFFLSFSEKKIFFLKMRFNVFKTIFKYLMLFFVVLLLTIIYNWKIGIGSLVLYLLFVVVSVMIKHSDKTVNYRKYMILNNILSFMNFVGIVKFLFLATISRKYRNLIKGKKVGLSIEK